MSTNFGVPTSTVAPLTSVLTKLASRQGKTLEKASESKSKSGAGGNKKPPAKKRKKAKPRRRAETDLDLPW